MLTRFHMTATLASFTLVLGSLAAPPSSAQQFSADIVQTPAKGSETEKLYVGQNKLRLQMLENGQPASRVIFDMAQNTMTIVNDRDHNYIDGNTPMLKAIMNQTGAPPLWRFFRPTSAGSPCDDWNNLVLPYAKLDTTRKPPHFTCTNLGGDIVNGRPAQKWGVTSVEDGKTESGYAWIDARLHVVSKSQDSNNTMELKNVVEAPQPDAVFQIPAGYQKLDLSALMSHLKGDSASLAGILGGVGKSAKSGAVEGAKEGAAEAAKDKAKQKVKSIFHVP